MRREVRDRWVAALRSGEFAQGRGKLAREYASDDKPTQYCCLGVLCELAYRDGVPLTRATSYNHGAHRTIAYDGEAHSLPDAVIRWAGLDCDDPAVDVNRELVNLAKLNDEYHYRFTQIADLIEEQL